MNTLRLLVVDDSERDAELLIRQVEAAGYNTASHRVDTAGDLATALAERAWDVVLADFRMPSLDGFGALDIFQRNGRDIPFVIVSGTVGEETAVALMKAGAHDYIMKDNLARLVPVIEREIAEAEQRRLRRQVELRLQQRERMLANAQRIAHLGSWERDLLSGGVDWSDEAFRIFGHEPASFVPDLTTYLGGMHPDDRGLVEQAIDDTLAMGARQEFEHRIVCPDGSVRWVFHQIGVESEERDRPVRLVGTLLDITGRKQAEEALRESEKNFRTLLEQAADGIVVANTEGRVITANTRACEMLGYEPGEFLGCRLIEFLDPRELDTRPLRDEQLRTGVTLTNERSLRRKDGRFVPTETSSRLLDDGRVQIIVRDITERKRAEAALRRSEEEYRNLFEGANDAIIIFDAENEAVLDVNPRACELYGIPYDLFVGRNLRTLLNDLVPAGANDEIQVVTADVRQFESVRYRSDGRRLYLTISGSVVEFGGRSAILSIQRDVSAEKLLEAQLRHQALHDALSGLPNRALFHDRLEHALARARGDGADVAVLVLDLDRFKLINDSLGHDVGDRFLNSIADRLLLAAREEDTVARLGGDEFSVLLEGVGSLREVTLVAERISNLLEMPVTLDGHDIVVTASIGIVLSASGQGRPDDLLRNADVAMYRAKEEGRSRYVVFDPSMNASVLERLKLEADLRQAIARGELRVYYQPTVDLATGLVTGMEALVRWMHPTRGLMPPALFIPLAEEAGLIRMVGQWVLTSACRQLRHWHARYPGAAPVVLNVNLSAHEFQHAEVVSDVAEALAVSGVTPQHLQLEITESVAMHDAPATHTRLLQLKELGVQLAIDDFGTGYSSLSYLKRFPVDTLKVDKAFVDGLGNDTDDTAIVEAMITLAHALGLSVTAEGVETEEAVELLHDLRCELGQGYYFTAPLPAEALEPLWANGLKIYSNWRSRMAS
jgi:diguanylate cyclase (GGDEF)-like protein/PAS domain S-box-containing protein